MIKEIKINSLSGDPREGAHRDLMSILYALKQCEEQYCVIIEVVENKFFEEYKSRIKKMQSLLGELTERESEVFRLAIDGRSNKEISQQLYISTETVKSHGKKIVSKAGVRKMEDIRNYFVSNLSYSPRPMKITPWGDGREMGQSDIAQRVTG